ncbi:MULTISPECIES: response regulator transcription factor [unclassified Streptomyces]|uniref:response regulator n=1 Tax=unclassified Streptomyces TaxID=2593676 RepID=UPI00278C28E4|nr:MULTISPECIES: response regulator transcription factor [unclassified Streptomyces]
MSDVLNMNMSGIPAVAFDGTRPTRVLVVDDHPALRIGLRTLLATVDDLAPAAEAASADEALRAARRPEAPDVALVDLDLGEGVDEGLRLVADLCALRPAPAVLVLSAYVTAQTVTSALRAGAAGFLGKDASAESLLAAVRAVARGETVLGPGVARYALPGPQGCAPVLTPREVDLVRLVANGLSNREIAVRQGISPSTVKSALSAVYTKLGADSRAAAVATAARQGLLAGRPPHSV